MVDDGIFVEKCCSRCDRISWDSFTNYYSEDCPVRGKLNQIQACDTVGRRMETDNTGNVRMFDKDGNEVTSRDYLEGGN